MLVEAVELPHMSQITPTAMLHVIKGHFISLIYCMAQVTVNDD